jgi:hypothetical protein
MCKLITLVGLLVAVGCVGVEGEPETFTPPIDVQASHFSAAEEEAAPIRSCFTAPLCDGDWVCCRGICEDADGCPLEDIWCATDADCPGPGANPVCCAGDCVKPFDCAE